MQYKLSFRQMPEEVHVIKLLLYPAKLNVDKLQHTYRLDNRFGTELKKVKVFPEYLHLCH